MPGPLIRDDDCDGGDGDDFLNVALGVEKRSSRYQFGIGIGIGIEFGI